jgi:WhiB family redox-sensing transcriptional regulator
MVQPAPEWRASGACLTADPDLFFPIATGHVAAKQITKAQQVCARCGVRQQCLEFAMRTGEAHGIWGGTTPEDRTRARRRHSARLRRATTSAA